MDQKEILNMRRNAIVARFGRGEIDTQTLWAELAPIENQMVDLGMEV